MASRQFDSARRDEDSPLFEESQTVCCCFNKFKWRLLWNFWSATRALGDGVYEYKVPLLIPEPVSDDEQRIRFLRQQTWGANLAPDFKTYLGNNATIQSHGRLTYDQYVLLCHKIHAKELQDPVNLAV